MSDSYDAIVVGLGGMGSAAICHLSQVGASVVGLDQFHPPHDRGSSLGEILAEMTIQGASKRDLSTFSIHRHMRTT